MLRIVTRVQRYSSVVIGLLAMAAFAACSKKPVNTVFPPVNTVARAETVTVRDPELVRRAARLELELWDRDTEADELQQRLDEARDEVVRAMAKLQTLATRAEAGSAQAEADVALEQLRGSNPQAAELRQATQLMERSTGEFNKQNYGGALYLAEEARKVATEGRRRAGASATAAARPGEVPFSLPVPLKVTGRANVRDGPGTTFSVVFTVESGTLLSGVSYLGEWVHVSDEVGRLGWVILSLVARR